MRDPLSDDHTQRRPRSGGRSSVLVCTAAIGAVLIGTVVSSCRSDGRTLRPARPDQVGSVSTLGTSTTVDPALVDAGQIDAGDIATLPPEPTAMTTALAGEPLDSSDLPAGSTIDGVGVDGSSDLPDGEDLGEGESILTGPFEQSAPIDRRYTCDDDNSSPPLQWTAAPDGTAEIAITMTDTDAPGFVHWVLAGLEPTMTSLDEAEVPEGAIVGQSSVGGIGYYGPCPPVGSGEHRYVFTVHFLSQRTELDGTADPADLLAAVQGATIGGASLVGTYEKF